MKKIYSILLLIFVAFQSNAQVLINEYSCSNLSTTTDAFGQFEDWVELYNAGATPVNLTGYYLSNDPNNLQMWQIPAVNDINGGSKKMIFCSNKGLVDAGTGQIHPKFKLRQTYGQWFVLSDPSGTVIDSVKLKITQRNHSRARTTDGATSWGVDNTPTPNAVNNPTYTSYASTPLINIQAGFYSSAQTISITSTDPNVTIRYTTNGTEPLVSSTAYTSPINIAVTTSVRAKAFSAVATVLPSLIETNSYMINETTNFPVVCVCGAYTPASANPNYLFTWAATPAWSSIEFFDKNQNFICETEGLASKHGNDSWAYAQKGFDFEASDESGIMASMNHNFFSTTLRDTFDRIILKAGSSDNFPLGPSNSCHLRDVFAQTLAEKYQLDMDFRRFEGSNLFVNGAYWGVYDLRERVDGDHFDYYYGQPSKKVDHLSYWGGLTIRLGSDTGWVNMYNYIMANNMAAQANYDHVKKFLNTRSFIQYFIFNVYLVNHDWLNWNTMWWRGNKGQGVKWRYALWDEDAICGLANANYTGLSTTSANADPCEPTSLFQGNSSIKHTDMLTALMNNPEFKQQYKDEWIHMLNTCFECQNIKTHFDSIVNLFVPDMPRQCARWSGSMTDWNANVQAMRTFLDNRCALITGKLDTCLDLNPQELKLDVSPAGSGMIALDGSVKSPYVWEKIIAGDSMYTLKATPTAGQYWAFDYWEKQNSANNFLPNSTTDLIQFDFKKKDSVVAHFKYFNYDSVNVTFDVTPPGTGSILLNGTLISSYPTTITLDRRYPYTIAATPIVNHNFVTWQKNNANTTIAPSMTDKVATLNYLDQETVVAEFVYVPPPPPPPPLPLLTAVDTSQVFIPNVFSPNGDGTNDLFSMRVGKDVTGIEMMIYDRWGKLVYQTNNLAKGWNGTYNGKDAEIGVYQYLIKVKFRDASVSTFKGDVTLLR